MQLDPLTMFAVLLVSMLTGTMLLFWCWWRNRNERSLLWLAVGYTFVSLADLLLGLRDRAPDLVSIDLANAIMLLGFAFAWAAARIFNGRPASVWITLAGPVFWLALLRIPAVHESYEWRVVVSAVVGAAYFAATAIEFARRDGIGSRYPVAVLLGFHAVALLIRIPLAVRGMVSGVEPIAAFGGGWFAPIAIESVVIAQAFAILMVSLIKERAEARLRIVALTDPLTELPNRRAFFERAASLIAQGARRGSPTSVIVFDLDRFKAINDTHGHPAGDAVIRSFANAVRTTIRAGDCAGRIGGEEFAAILPDTDALAARVAAERIMRAFSRLGPAALGDEVECTTSAGLAAAERSEQPIDAMIIAADRALYEAKRQGGNRLRTAVSPVLAVA